MPPDLDALLTVVYVQLDDLLPRRTGAGRRPRCNDAEILTLAVAQALLNEPSDRQFLRRAATRLRHLFPCLPSQPSFHRRLRRLAPLLDELVRWQACASGAADDDVWLLDSTPLPCAASRQTVRRSDLAGFASYGYCRSHSRYFWGCRLHLVCDLDGHPVSYALTAANAAEREVAEDLLQPLLRHGQTLIADKGYAGRDHAAFHTDHGSVLLRPDRADEPTKLGSLGFVRQRIESVFDSCKDQLGLERHGARSLLGLSIRISQRLLALGYAIDHNRRHNHYPRRSLLPYSV